MSIPAHVIAISCLLIGVNGTILVQATIGITYEDGRKYERAEAIKARVAEYIVNPKTGETAFQYKTPKPLEKP